MISLISPPSTCTTSPKATPSRDGNKRTGYISALVFLGINGINILLPENVHDLANATIAAANDKATKGDIAALMRGMPRHQPEG